MKLGVLCVVALLVAGLPIAERGLDGGLVRAQESPRGASDEAVALDPASREALLARWNRLTPEDQTRLRERFRRFQELSDDDREALAARTRRIQARARIFYELFSAEERARLDRLAPEKRREILITLATEEEDEQAARLRGALPPELSAKLADHRPEHRRGILDELRRRQEERLGPAIERFGLELGLELGEIERLTELPFDERKQRFLELAKELSTEHIAGRDLPPGLTAFRWEIMKQLEPEEFFAAVLRLRAKHPDLGWLPRRAGESDDADERDELRAAMMQIRAAARLDEDDLIELASRPTEERRAEQMRRRRERLLAFLRREDLLPPERVQELADADDERFVELLRELTTLPPAPAQLSRPLEELNERVLRRATQRAERAARESQADGASAGER